MYDYFAKARTLARVLVYNERNLRGRLLTASLRCEPSFLIIGAQKAGTTSLYSYLCRHPGISQAVMYEVHYFNLAYHRPWWWYKAHFPLRAPSRMTGEASPYYLFHPLVPGRVHAHLPRVRLIALLRDPVDRAFSAYQHAHRSGTEELSFEEALEREEDRTRGEEERLRREPGYRSAAHRTYSYAARGRYAEQLARWLDVFPREQLLVLRSEDMFADPAGACAKVYEHLGLSRLEPADYPVFNQGGYRSQMDPDVRKRLAEYFRPHNRRLEEMLGWESSWAL